MVAELLYVITLAVILILSILSQRTILLHLDKQTDLAKYALDCMKAGSLQEKIEADVYKKQQDIALEQLNESYEQEINKIKQKTKPLPIEEEYVDTVDGRRFQANRLELITPDDLI